MTTLANVPARHPIDPIEAMDMGRHWQNLADDGEAVPVNFEQFAREWEAGAAERDRRREQIGQFFDEIRDRQKAAEWGCSVEELPWRMRARIAAGKAILV